MKVMSVSNPTPEQQQLQQQAQQYYHQQQLYYQQQVSCHFTVKTLWPTAVHVGQVLYFTWGKLNSAHKKYGGWPK